jgi:hypothetical protein
MLMGFRIGVGYLGSPSLETSTANKEVIPNSPVGWTGRYNLYKFSFDNAEQACSVKINGGSPIYLKAGQGFEIQKEDAPIWSFVIVEAGVSYNWIGAY